MRASNLPEKFGLQSILNLANFNIFLFSSHVCLTSSISSDLVGLHSSRIFAKRAYRVFVAPSSNKSLPYTPHADVLPVKSCAAGCVVTESLTLKAPIRMNLGTNSTNFHFSLYQKLVRDISWNNRVHCLLTAWGSPHFPDFKMFPSANYFKFVYNVFFSSSNVNTSDDQ